MSNSKFEIKIITEADGTHVDLANLSLQASKSLVTLLNAFNTMAEAEEGSSEIRVSVKQGSATVELEAPDAVMNSIQANVEAVLDRRQFKGAYWQSIKSIQDIIKANGLTYESTIYQDNDTIELVDILKGRKRLARRRQQRQQDFFDIIFIEGKLIENGGVKPNIHVDWNGVKQKIACTQQQARRVNAFLYNNIRISAWVQLNALGQKIYTMCDSYANKELFDEFHDEVRPIVDEAGTQPLIRIHKKFKHLITEGRVKEARKFVRFFTNDAVDNHRLRTILVAAKSFREHDEFKDLLSKTVDILERKTGKHIV